MSLGVEIEHKEGTVDGCVVPTTTPPLVWPSNGQNKGAPTKILNPTSMEGWI